MSDRKFKLHELGSLEYLQWELQHEAEKPRCRSNEGKIKDGRAKNGGSTNDSLIRTLAKSQRQMLRDLSDIKEMLQLLTAELDTKQQLKEKFEEVQQ